MESAGAAILADVGSGAFANVIRFRAAEDIDAVVISHMHADHFIDIIPMRYALKYGNRTNARRVALHLPPGGIAMLQRLTAAFERESSHDFMGEVFDLHEYDASKALTVGDARIRFAPTSHYIPTWAMRFEAAGASITYSADTAPDDRVADLALRTDAFVCEATLSIDEEADVPRGHVSAREAGRMAARAGVRRLVLSHFPASADPATLESLARSTFAGPIDVADDGFRLSFPGTNLSA